MKGYSNYSQDSHSVNHSFDGLVCNILLEQYYAFRVSFKLLYLLYYLTFLYGIARRGTKSNSGEDLFAINKRETKNNILRRNLSHDLYVEMFTIVDGIFDGILG